MPVFRDSEKGEKEAPNYKEKGLVSSEELARLKKIDPAVGPTRCKHCGNHSTIVDGKRTCCGEEDTFDPLDGRR